jgi:hypothetical protein
MSEEEFERRLEPMVENLPTVADGHAALVALVDRTIAELTERRELVGLREERDLALDEVIARADVSRDGALRERYDGMATRDQHASLREFCRLKELRHKHGEGEPEPQQPEDNSGDPPPPSGPGQTVPEAPAQSEATVAEVDDAVEEGESPVDVSQTAEPQPLFPWERMPAGRVRADAPPGAATSGCVTPTLASALTRPSATLSQGERVLAAAHPSATASPEAADPPEDDEAIRTAYEARLERVLERIERDPLANDHPPPGVETSA